MNFIATAVPAASVNLRGSWTKFWQAIEGAYPGLGAALGVIGMIIVLGAVAKFLWDRRRGGGSASPLWGAILIGALLAAPTVIMPIALTIIDWIANMGLAVLKVATGAS